jgi:glycosyltransferase involved in cell wall biosynthesis
MKKKNNKISIKIILFVFYLYFIIFFKNELVVKPKVSVFLPIFNKESYIIRSINSIKKQTLSDIEIIAVNDFSTDGTLKILKKLIKKDKRIKIVNNDRNHGLLYSRAMGILNSSGEYVMNLDPDDILSDKNNLKILYSQSKMLNLDTITFLQKKINVKSILFLNEQIKRLDINNFRSNLKFPKYNYPMITNKFIKKDIIIKAYNCFKKQIYKNKWNYYEDVIWNIFIKKYSKYNKNLNRYIYLYLLNNQSLMKNKKNSLEMKNTIYKLEMIFNIIYFQQHKKVTNKIIGIILNIKRSHKSIINKDKEIKKKFFNLFIQYTSYFFRKNISFNQI